MELVRYLAIAIWIIFCCYSLYVLRKENFFKSVKSIWSLHWGRQVTADLYVGILLFSFMIYLIEGSVLTALAWSIPALIIGNPITLLYFIIKFDSFVSYF
ncbi:MAG: hypothetical protein V4736_08330 [Bdellovibrionota bacterium]